MPCFRGFFNFNRYLILACLELQTVAIITLMIELWRSNGQLLRLFNMGALQAAVMFGPLECVYGNYGYTLPY
jgi:hypothetical protein